MLDNRDSRFMGSEPPMTTVKYQTNAGPVDHIYICTSNNPNAQLTDEKWRIIRLTQVADPNFQGDLLTVSFAEKDGKGTSDFVFEAVDLSYVSNLDYNL